MPNIKVIIIDKQPLFRAGVKQAFAEQSDFEIIEANPSDDLPAMIESLLPDVILLDIDSPSLSGLKTGRTLLQRYPAIRLIIMSPEVKNEELFEVIRIGAAAYLDKKSTTHELDNLIHRVSRGEYPINDSLLASPAVAEHVLKQFQEMVSMGMSVESIAAPLTNREKQILSYVAEGNSNKKIAQILDISEQTIKNHVSSILRKLNANDRAHAVVLAIRAGLISVKENTNE
jgi:two-component system, NarL family, response regulator DegU